MFCPFTRCKHTKVAFLHSHLVSIRPTTRDRKWANAVRRATTAAHAFSCSLDVRPHTVQTARLWETRCQRCAMAGDQENNC